MYNASKMKRSWLEIDLDQLKKNYYACKDVLSDDCQIMAVVKAEAYGHGDIAICKELNKCGVDYFIVSNLDEAISLRKGNIKGEILIVGYTPLEYIDSLYRYDITQTILSEEYADELISKGAEIKCQVAIDTGMNRIGLDGDNTKYCIDKIHEYAKSINVNGAFTHLCAADEKNECSIEFTKKQIIKFKSICSGIKDLKLPYLHYMNSAGSLYYGDGTSARLGIILYGLKPNIRNDLPAGIKPILSWKSVVSMVKKVKKSECIGYGCSYKVKNDIIVATIPTGYADGYRRGFSNVGHVLINGKRAPIVGKICMDQMMVDVTNIPEVKMGTEVTLIGKNGNEVLYVDDMACSIKTIGYEIICGISKRVPRLYVR